MSPQLAAKHRTNASSKASRDKGRPRLQLEFSPEAYNRLAGLKQVTGSRTNAEVIRKALHVLDWLVSKTKDDYKLQLVKGDTTREVEIVI